VVGATPALARVAAGTAVLAAVLLATATVPAYAVVGGQSAGPGGLDRIAGLLWPLLIAAAAASVLVGWLPRFGLAFLGVTGALGPGLVLQRLYAWQPVSDHRAVEVVAGRRLVTSTFEPGTGAVLDLAGAAVLVLTLVLTMLAWPRTPMDDDGGFDGRRQVTLGVSAFAGLLGVLAVSARGIAAPALVTQDAIGFRTSVEVAADVAVLERFGFDRAGGLLLALGVILAALIAAGLRPRLAVVGALAGLSAWAGPAALVLVLQAARFDDVVPGLGAWLLLLCGLVFGGLAGWARAAAPRAAGELGSDLPGGGLPRDTSMAGLPPDRGTAQGGAGDD
ncbi:MAG: hypothetical protein H0T85_05570, partial [Geodermatophilaceae bacterium]|nr:hypothetical protein [Geodermatophilaceae bacterium]